MDSFWSKPPPPLSSLSPDAYNIPYGTNCLGINDRFGIGTWRTTRFALARLSMLPLIRKYRGNLSQLNSEKAFEAQMDASCTPVARAHFPFCILSRRVYATDLMPVAALSSVSPLNGAKCRPCTPWLTGPKAEKVLEAYQPAAQIGPIITGVDLCYARVPWEPTWPAIYDAATGPLLARHRRLIESASFQACVTHLAELQRRAAIWDAPQPHVFCFRNGLGLVEALGGDTTSLNTFIPRLKKHLGRTRGKTVVVLLYSGMSWGVVGTTASQPFSSSAWKQALEARGKTEGFDVQTLMVLPGQGEKGITVLGANGAPEPAPDRPHIVLLTLEQSELVAVLRSWVQFGNAPKVCQLMVAYRRQETGVCSKAVEGGVQAYTLKDGVKPTCNRDEGTDILVEIYFHLDSCIQEPSASFERCTYFSLMYCS